MKIALCCRVYPTFLGGGMPYVCQDRAEELAKEHEVFVLTSGNRKDRLLNNVRVRTVGGKEGAYSREYAEGCEAFCNYLNPDVTHLDSFSADQLWWQDRKVGVTLHGFGPGGFFTKWNHFKMGGGAEPEWNNQSFIKEIKALKKAKVVIGISLNEHNYLKELYSLSNSALVYNPIPNYFFEPKATKARTYFLSMEKNISASRGFEGLKELFRENDLPLQVVRGRERTEMPDILDSALALILPTCYSQGYDLTVAEAHARGVPVIASHVGSYSLESLFIGGLSTYPLGDTNALVKLARKQYEYPFFPSRTVTRVLRHSPERHASHWLEVMNG